MKRIGFFVSTKKYSSPEANPHYSFKKELCVIAVNGNVVLEKPLEFTSTQVLITGLVMRGDDPKQCNQ